METAKSDRENTTKTRRLSPLIAAIAIPLLGFFCYGIPYITGISYHQSYLSGFGIPIDLFPNDPLDNLTASYIAFLIALQNLLPIILSPIAWAYGILIIGGLLIYAKLLDKISKAKTPEFASRIISNNPTLRKIFGTITISTSITFFVFLLPIALTPLLALPAIIGDYSAKISVKRDIEKFSTDCDNTKTERERCFSLRDKYGSVSTGYVIASSSSQIALYNQGHVGIYPIEGRSLETVLPNQKEKASNPDHPTPTPTP